MKPLSFYCLPRQHSTLQPSNLNAKKTIGVNNRTRCIIQLIHNNNVLKFIYAISLSFNHRNKCNIFR